MTRLKLIKKITSEWFDSHKFVNEVYWGDFIRWYADKQLKHSSVIITPIRVTEVTRSKRAIQLQITYADRVYADFRNLDEVHSDADRTLADFVLSASNDKDLRKYLTGLTSGSIEYFTNRTGDLVAGATMSVSLNVFSDANSCEIPVEFEPLPPPFECADATFTISDSQGNLIDSGSIPSGGNENVSIADSVITVNSSPYTSLLATDSLDIPIVDIIGNAVTTTVIGSNVQVSPIPYSVNYKTGQNVVISAGDDGATQRGVGVDWFNLGWDNYFGHQKRFTGTTGGYYDEVAENYKDVDGVVTTNALAFPEDIVLDWAQYNPLSGAVYGMYRALNNVDVDYLDNQTYVTGLTTASWSGFVVPNINELYAWAHKSNQDVTFDRALRYEPLLTGGQIGDGSFVYWSSTIDSASRAKILINNFATIERAALTGSSGFRSVAIRIFNISEL